MNYRINLYTKNATEHFVLGIVFCHSQYSYKQTHSLIFFCKICGGRPILFEQAADFCTTEIMYYIFSFYISIRRTVTFKWRPKNEDAHSHHLTISFHCYILLISPSSIHVLCVRTSSRFVCGRFVYDRAHVRPAADVFWAIL